jgi:hypothetical protein
VLLSFIRTQLISPALRGLKYTDDSIARVAQGNDITYLSEVKKFFIDNYLGMRVCKLLSLGYVSIDILPLIYSC